MDTENVIKWVKPDSSWRHCRRCEVYWKSEDGEFCWMCSVWVPAMPVDTSPLFSNVASQSFYESL